MCLVKQCPTSDPGAARPALCVVLGPASRVISRDIQIIGKCTKRGACGAARISNSLKSLFGSFFDSYSDARKNFVGHFLFHGFIAFVFMLLN